MRPSALKAVFVILATEMHRRLADRSIIISSFVAPAVIAGIIGFAFGNAGPTPHVDLGVAIVNPTPAATKIVDAGIASGGFGPSVDVVMVATSKELNSRVSSGALGAGVIVPSGFGSAESFGLSADGSKVHSVAAIDSQLPALLADVSISTGHGPPGARLKVVSPSSSTLSGQLGQALAAAISSRLYEGALETSLVSSRNDPDATALLAQAQAAANHKIGFLISELDIGNNHSVIGYYGSSLAVVFLFIGAGLGARAIAIERTGGTLTRLAAAPVASQWIVVGKMAAVFLTAMIGLLVIWAETLFLFKASWGNPPGVILMCLAVSLAMCSLAMFLTSLAKNEAQAYAASIIVGIVLGILGGNFFPPGALPGPLQVITLGTPNGWALVGFGRLALTDATISGLVAPLSVLGVISLVFICLAGIRMRRVVEL